MGGDFHIIFIIWKLKNNRIFRISMLIISRRQRFKTYLQTSSPPKSENVSQKIGENIPK